MEVFVSRKKLYFQRQLHTVKYTNVFIGKYSFEFVETASVLELK